MQGDASGGEGGFGGFGSFSFVIVLALSLLLLVIAKSNLFFYKFIFLLAAIATFALSIIHNTKRESYDLIMLLILSVYAFDIRIKLRSIIVGAVAVVVLVLFVSPTLHLMRSSFKEEALTDRVSGFFDLLSEYNFDPAALAAAEAKYLSGFSYAYSSSGSYVYPSQANVDRFALILPIDQVARRVDDLGVMGLSPFILEMLEQVLPSILINKTPYTGPDLIAWKYGIRAQGNIARPVIGMVASSLAAAGIMGVIFFPILFVLPVLLAMDYIFGALKGSAWGVFGTAASVFLMEKEFERMLPYLFRDLMLIVAFAYLVVFARSAIRRFAVS